MGLLQMMISSSVELEEQELAAFAQSRGVSLQAKDYLCVLADFRGQITSCAQLGSRCLEIANCCQLFWDKQHVHAIVDQHGTGCVMLLMDAGGREGLDKLLDKLIMQLRKHCFDEIILTAGGQVDSLSRVRETYDMAMHAMQYQEVYPERSVIFSEDLDSIHHRNTLLPSGDFRRTTSAFLAGDMPQLRLLLIEDAERVRAQPGVMYPSSIRRTMIELMLEMMHIASDAGVDVDRMMQYEDPYKRIFNMNSTPEIIEWMILMCTALSQEMRERRMDMQGRVILQAKEYINEHLCDPQLNLEAVSASVGLSASYFSAFFMRETRIGFRDYVNTVRIERAKERLAHSGERVADIAKGCGFGSENYFISVFKKYVNATPGAYRQRCRRRNEEE